MKVKEMMDQMRSEGYSEDDIFDAVSKDKDLLARFHQEDAGEQKGPKPWTPESPGPVPHKGEPVGSDKSVLGEMIAGPGWGDSLEEGGKAAAGLAGRFVDAVTPFHAWNRASEAIAPGSTEIQNVPSFPGSQFVESTMDATGAGFNPVNRAVGGVAGKLAGMASKALPVTQGFGQSVGRAIGRTAIDVGAGAGAGAALQAGQEATEGFPQGSGRRIGGAAVGAGMLGGAGSIIGQIGEGLQKTKGARARKYADLGVEEAKVTASDPQATTRQKAEAQEVIKHPQSGMAARLGMDIESDLKHPGVRSAYQAADAAAPGQVIDARPLIDELRGAGQFRAPGVRAQMDSFLGEIARYQQPGPNGQILIPADTFNQIKKAIGNKGAFASVPGVTPDDFAPADAIARKLNSQVYGEADRLKTLQEVDREAARRSMGLSEEPGANRTEADQRKLEDYLQPSWNPRYTVSGNVKMNAQAFSSLPAVQGASRGLQASGSAMAQPQVAAPIAQALQNWVMQKQAEQQRKASIIHTIFGKKEQDNGLRQQNSDAPGP